MSDIAERKVGDLTVQIDRLACSALEACIREAPEVFCMGADNIVTFADTPDRAPRERVLEACRACPVAALSAIDEQGQRLVP
jgi:ferredoxin